MAFSLPNWLPARGVGARTVLIALCCIGVALRVWVLYARGALWLDEAHLASAMLQRSWGQMWLPLGNDQIAPLGFLLAAKAFLNIVPSQELALRLPAFIAGIGTIPAALWLCRQRQDDALATNLLIAGVCLLPPFVMYAAEFKQYAAELLFGFLTLAAFEGWRRTPSRMGLALLAAIGLLCAACTITAPFLLVVPGAVVSLTLLQRRAWPDAVLSGCIGLAWVMMFFYQLHVVAPPSSSTVAAMQESFWKDHMLPHTLFKMPRWLLEHALAPFDALGFGPASPLLLLATCLGVATGFARDRIGTLVLLAPAVLAFAAALVGKYPFTGRLILFTAAGLLPLAITGLRQLGAAIADKTAVLIAATVLILFFPLNTLAGQIFRRTPFALDAIPKMFAHIGHVYQAGDYVYVSSYALPSYRIYGDRMGVPPTNIRLGHDPRAEFGNTFNLQKPDNFAWFMHDIATLPQPARIWLVLTRTDEAATQVLWQTLLHACRTHGRATPSLETRVSAVYLCELTTPSPAEPAPAGAYQPIHKSYLLEESPHEP